MGGRLDATNVIENPKLSVITAVDYDHQHYLGTTLTEIAREKSGIIRRGVPTVVAVQPEEGAVLLKQDRGEAKRIPFAAIKEARLTFRIS